ncbi:MAG: metal-dependent transcriptional regulator [Anaerolineales bacterium]|jgi:DtxR family Mn-dependent transcriptional regulator
MPKNFSTSTEDYLKSIYELTVNGERATTNQIAERLEVTPASVTGMLKRLVSNDPPLIEYRKHRGVELTPEGEAVALEVIRHHRLIELFLHETLGYSWDEVHKEADRLEHVISEELEERIAQALGDPISDPHGEPIPTRELVLPAQSAIHLTDLRAGQKAVVQRVEDDDPELLRYFHSLGLVPQAQLHIVEYSRFDGNLSLRVSDQEEEIVLGPRVTRHIFVEVI